MSQDIDPESHDTEKDQKDQSDQRGDELGGSVGCRFGWLRNSKEVDKLKNKSWQLRYILSWHGFKQKEIDAIIDDSISELE